MGNAIITGGNTGQLKVWQVTSPQPRSKTTLLKGEWWEVLGVDPNADSQTAKAAYYRMAKEYHPDVNDTEVAKANIQAIIQAYREFQGRN
jgi:DnaJ-domain-containing protein 1